MANTRDTLGDQATLDGLVSHTLENFEDDRVTSLRGYAFRNNTGLKRCKLPNLATVPSHAFYGSGLTKIEATDMPDAEQIGDNAFNAGSTSKAFLTEVEFPKGRSIGSYAFYYHMNLKKAVFRSSNLITFSTSAFDTCYALRHLVIDSNSKSAYQISDKELPFIRGEGAVYVPTDMVATYKSDANWGKLLIEDIANYPLEKFETITDSWAEIVANQNYATDYAIGDTKAIKIGSLWYTAEIVGIDKDVDANGDTIPLTWMLIDLLADTHRMNASATNANGWVATEMRSYLISDILPNIDIKDLIVPAVKTFYDYTTQSTLSCTDSVWIPSARELGFSREDSGCIYDGRFASNSNRIKYAREKSANTYWIRTPYQGGTNFTVVTYRGGAGGIAPTSTSTFICLGFCTM